MCSHVASCCNACGSSVPGITPACYLYLQDIDEGMKPQYGALVFNDSVGADIAGAVRRGLSNSSLPVNASAGLLPPQAADLISTLLGATPEGR